MKRIIFWLLVLVGVFLVIRISQIVLSKHEMTDFVFGYLVGQIILLMVVIVLTVILGRSKFKR